MRYVYGKKLKTFRDRLSTLVAAAVILASNSAVALPLLLTQRASAIVPSDQGFESDTAGWTDGGSYGTIQRVSSGTNGVASSSGGSHALVTEAGSGPYTYFSGRSSVWTGVWTAEVDVYLDPAWANGSGFEYSVAATKQDNSHLRDFVFHVTKDTSTGSLLVGGSNNAASSPRQDLETINHYVVPSAGWYTLRHSFRDQAGSLAVDLQLLDAADAVLFTETRTTPSDLIASVVGGNRYGWFTDVTVPGGLAIDNVSLSGNPAPVVNVDTNEEFTTIKAAVQDSDTVNGHTLEVNGELSIIDNTVVNKDVTIHGNSGAAITTSGTTQLFTITANGVTIENIAFTKTDNASQHNLIGIQADNVSISDNTFTGQYVAPSGGDVSRAIVVSPGADNVTISGNTVTNMRQPAYLDNQSNGTISNNLVTGTRGWVVEKASSYTFSGNTWGTNNPVDIAIIPGSNPGSTPNNYTCQIAAIKAANNNPVIEDQAPAPLSSCPNTPPAVSFIAPSPDEGAQVSGTITSHVLATDDHGMGSYYLRFWKDTFEVAGGGTLLHGCQSAPGAFLLGTSQDVSCDFDTSSLPDGTTLVLSAQFLDGHNQWGQALRTVTVNNTPPDTTKPSSTHDLADYVKGTVTITQQISDDVAPKSGKLRIWGLTGGVQDNSKFYAIGDINVDGDNKVVYTLNTLTNLYGDGEYVAKFTATDMAGNQSVVQKNFTVDNTRSEVNYITPSSDGETLAEADSIEVQFSDNVALDRVTVHGYVNGTSTSVPQIWVHPFVTGTDHTITLPLTGIPEGTYQIRAAAIDKAGNSRQINRTFIISGEVLGTQTVIKPTVTYSPITCEESGSAVLPAVEGAKWVYESPVGHTANWDSPEAGPIDVVLSGPGMFRGWLVAEDGYVVEDAETPIFEHNILAPDCPPADTTAPKIKITNPSKNEHFFFGQLIWLCGTVNEDVVGVKVKVDNLAPKDAFVWNHNWCLLVNWPLSFGSHNVKATAIDLAGNAGTSKEVKFTYSPAWGLGWFSPPRYLSVIWNWHNNGSWWF